MASLIPGYNYDIFISYRQKDNKYDGWVTEFADNIRKELEATFKEEISVYFDINPHDGLLETHDVDSSLKEKLKCLVFIPIISRTYCDPKSFAWEHEFRAFIGEASNDLFGLKVKLPNGNVANRVLPVKIHDLDANDIQLCESVLGGVLRGVEFIYKEAGVNRSLTPRDDERKNLNATIYRNQINKVALAIKEIIIGMQTETVSLVNEKNQNKESLEKISNERKRNIHGKLKILTSFTIVAILLIAGIIAWPKIIKHDTSIPVTVMPFQNNSNDTLLDYLQDGIQNNLVTSLSYLTDLKVKQTELVTSYLQSKGLTSNASMTPSIAKIISKKLGVSFLVDGGFIKEDSVLRLTAQLWNSKKGDVIESFQIDGRSDKIIGTMDSLSDKIRTFLQISILRKKLESPALQKSWPISTSSTDAYRFNIYGSRAYAKGQYSTAVKEYLKALKADSTFFMTEYLLSAAYWGVNMMDSSKYWCRKVYNRRAQLRPIDQLRVSFMYAKCFETDFEAIEYLKKIIELDENDVIDMWLLGLNYSYTQQNEKAIELYEKALKIYDKWDSKPIMADNYTRLIGLYHKVGQHKKEKRLYKRAEQDFPLVAGSFFYYQAVHAFAEKDIAEANRYKDKYISYLTNRSVSEAIINLNLSYIYTEAKNLGEAESCLRRNLYLEPKNLRWQNLIGYFLINTERNIDEGLQYLDTLRKKYPDNYTYLANYGYGLYKKEKFKEALEILNKSWDIRKVKDVYDHQAWLRLEEAKKAAAEQK